MTTQSVLAVPGAARVERSLEIGRIRTFIASLLIVLSVALLSASSARHESSAVDLAQSVPTSPRAQEVPTEANQLRHLVASAPSQKIEALAGLVARKYRISQDATREFVGTAYREGERNGLDPLLIIAVMAVESRFNPIAASDAGAIGLMQVIPRYHSDKVDAASAESVLNPRTNIRVGAKVLKDYIRRAGNQVAGLQLYNGTPDDVSNAYANKVLGERQRLQDAVRRVGDRA